MAWDGGAWPSGPAGRGVLPAWRAWCFGAALVSVWIALLSPIAVYSELFFFMHMTQHLMLTVVVAPLMWLGAPLIPVLWALPRGLRVAHRVAVRARQPPGQGVRVPHQLHGGHDHLRRGRGDVARAAPVRRRPGANADPQHGAPLLPGGRAAVLVARDPPVRGQAAAELRGRHPLLLSAHAGGQPDRRPPHLRGPAAVCHLPQRAQGVGHIGPRRTSSWPGCSCGCRGGWCTPYRCSS